MLATMARFRLAPLLLAVALAPAAHAAVLYKSVGPNGVIEFSDQPPSANAKLIEQRDLAAPAPSQAANGTMAGTARGTLPIEALENDDEVMRASQQVDLAEHALALARRGVWSPTEGLRLQRISRSASDDQRIEYYKRGVLLARQNLVEVMKRRAAALSVPGMPYVAAVASR